MRIVDWQFCLLATFAVVVGLTLLVLLIGGRP